MDGALDGLTPGTALGPYDLVAPVGVGGMARVWAARVRESGELVALKMLLPELAENPTFQQMFFDEARIASRVHHVNVCETYSLSEDDGILYLAMEWVDGPSLMRLLHPGGRPNEDEPLPLAPRVAARIVAEACGGLHAAHELLGEDGRPLAVVHRDVSPHNLLITTDGRVKVTDFGVAKALGKSHMTVAGQIKGKLAYMAPEQLVGGAIDRRCDVFALGCILYEITTGERPFRGDHDPQVMTAIMMGRYELPSALIPTYPLELEAIITRALASEPDHRYPTADRLRQALEGYLRNSGPPIIAQQVAAVVAERCGSEIDARRVLLHCDQPRPVASPRRSASSPAAANGAVDVGDHGRPSGRALRIVAAVLFGSTLGVAVLAYVHAARKAHATKLDGAIEIGPRPTNPPPLSSSRPMASAKATPPSTTTPVRLHIRPPGAVLVIDGVVLPRGTEAISRPDDGGTVTVLVRAERHEDTIVLVDGATPDDVDVELVPLSPRTRSAPASSATAATTGSAASSVAPSGRATPQGDGGPPAKDGADAAATGTSEAPPNPYE